MLPHYHQTGINLLCIYILYRLSLSLSHTHTHPPHTKNKKPVSNDMCNCGLRLHNGTFNHILRSHILCTSQNTKAATTLCFATAACGKLLFTMLWAHSTSTAWHATHYLPSARCSLTQNQVKKLSFLFSLSWDRCMVYGFRLLIQRAKSYCCSSWTTTWPSKWS